jgi:hypothetical protein
MTTSPHYHLVTSRTARAADFFSSMQLGFHPDFMIMDEKLNIFFSRHSHKAVRMFLKHVLKTLMNIFRKPLVYNGVIFIFPLFPTSPLPPPLQVPNGFPSGFQYVP